MNKKKIEQLQKVVDTIIRKIDKVVPVVGNMLFEFEDKTKVYSDFFSSVISGTNDKVDGDDRKVVLPGNVIDFLAWGNFELILTTSPFDVLDQALKKKGVAVESHWHKWGQKDSTNVVSVASGKTLVYHLFGEYGFNIPRNDKDLLECLWSHQDIQNNTLSKLLEDKLVLLLRSGMPNWMFLWLWYPLIKTSGYKYMFDHEFTSDEDFQSCMNSLDFKSEIAMEMFIDLANKKLKPHETPQNDCKFEYDVFLSYKREDMALAEKICEHLKEKWKLKVWFDKEEKDMNNPGPYYKRIAEGLDKSRTFMPVIGVNYFKRFSEYYKHPIEDPANKDEGLITETYMAMERKAQIIKANGLNGAYEIPVVNVDMADDLVLDSMIRQPLSSLGLFEQINWYGISFSGEKSVSLYKDFMSKDDWDDFFDSNK